jgi:S-sulfo-L-cysteine synthase (O-acetyl-L-serine-dependent)
VFAPDTALVAGPSAVGRPARAQAATDPLIAAVGATPLVPLWSVAASAGPSFELWAKVESFNPSGSVKDRAALAIVRAALADGRLGNGRTLVDASSGNTGVAFALLGARLGFAVRLYVPRNANPARLRSIRAYGAEVVLTDPGEGTDGAQVEARAFAERDPERYFFADQYRNPANPRAHYLTTGPEIWRQSAGRLTHFVAGVGTGGTISGAGRFLKEQRPDVRVIGVEPTGPLHGLEGLKHLPTALMPSTYDPAVLDTTVRIDTESAERMAVRLARDEGLRVGPSAGAAVVASLEVASSYSTAVVVTVLPDAGEPRAEGLA